ncbi:MAG: acetyltransferase [Bacteroidaceae bacterium]|nr:acetyltransferase [Bacteroidaceae bacterium]
MKDIAIYGAGGFGREVACLINIINETIQNDNDKWNIIGFFDDVKEKGAHNEYGVILGGLSDLNAWSKPLSVVIAIATPRILKKIINGVTNKLIDWPNIISPDVVFLDKNNFSIGKGNIICSRCFISCNVVIGNFNILNGYVTVGHDDKIGNYNCIMPGVRLSGELTIGDGNFFGVSSVVLQQLKIGNDITIGANSLILRKPKDGCTYVGNPAKKIEF